MKPLSRFMPSPWAPEARGTNPPGLASPAPRRFRCSRGFIHGLLALTAAPALTAQEVLNWGDFELCDDCQFEMTDRSRDPPETRLTGLALDADDNLWMTVTTADPEWDKVPLVQTRIGFEISPGYDDDYFDTRLDVFNLRERRHLGRYVWDPLAVNLLDRGGEPAVYLLEYDNAMVPQIVVYRAGSAAP